MHVFYIWTIFCPSLSLNIFLWSCKIYYFRWNQWLLCVSWLFLHAGVCIPSCAFCCPLTLGYVTYHDSTHHCIIFLYWLVAKEKKTIYRAYWFPRVVLQTVYPEQKSVVSQFWRLQVWGQGIEHWGVFWRCWRKVCPRPLLAPGISMAWGILSPVFTWRPHCACLCVWSSPFIRTHWMRGPPYSIRASS